MLPYPLLTFSLLVMWLLLNGFTFGHLVLGSLVAVASSWAMAALRPDKPKLRKWYLIPKLFGIVMLDIVRSNFAVCIVILRGRAQGNRSAFVNIPLKLKGSHWPRSPGNNRHKYARLGMARIRLTQQFGPDTRPRSCGRGRMARSFVRPIREAAVGDFFMNAIIIYTAVGIAQVMLTIAMAISSIRMFYGPRAQDRIIGLDALYVNSMLLVVTFAIGAGKIVYFEASLVIGLLGFVSSVSLAKFLMRGEVIE